MDRYDKALAKARAGKSLEEIFPEMKDSEDERVRKWLIEEIKATHDYDSPTSKKCVDDALAYLERQKKQKPAIKLVFPKFRVGDIIRNVHDEWDKTTKRISYVGKHGYNFDYRHLVGNAGGGSFGFCYEDYYELVEQKPAEWSEEDERLLSKLELYVDMECFDRECNGEDLRNWLKSLRPRPHWKPSEEQMNALYDILHPADPVNLDTVESLYNDLKKLL